MKVKNYTKCCNDLHCLVGWVGKQRAGISSLYLGKETEAVDEEEVPTRTSLRRQADIIMNAKQRGRGRRGR